MTLKTECNEDTILETEQYRIFATDIDSSTLLTTINQYSISRKLIKNPPNSAIRMHKKGKGISKKFTTVLQNNDYPKNSSLYCIFLLRSLPFEKTHHFKRIVHISLSVF